MRVRLESDNLRRQYGGARHCKQLLLIWYYCKQALIPHLVLSRELNIERLSTLSLSYHWTNMGHPPGLSQVWLDFDKVLCAVYRSGQCGMRIYVLL